MNFTKALAIAAASSQFAKGIKLSIRQEGEMDPACGEVSKFYATCIDDIRALTLDKGFAALNDAIVEEYFNDWGKDRGHATAYDLKRDLESEFQMQLKFGMISFDIVTYEDVNSCEDIYGTPDPVIPDQCTMVEINEALKQSICWEKVDDQWVIRDNCMQK